MKKIVILVTTLILASTCVASATFIPIDIPLEIRNGTFQYDYNTVPTSPLGGIPFSIPTVNQQQPYNYFMFYDALPNSNWTLNSGAVETLSLHTGSLAATNAYLLLNTNWGKPGFTAGRVTFNTLSGSNPFSIDLVGDYNIRDWNNAHYSNQLTAPNVNPVFTVASDFYGLAGRIDMLSVALPSYFTTDPLDSILFTDFGQDGLSRLRVEGITVDALSTPVPEPSTFLLFAVGAAALCFKRFRRTS